MYCDFKTLIDILYMQIVNSTIKSYNSFINTLFSSYIYAKRDHDLDTSETSKLSTGERVPSKNWAEFYKTKDRSVLLSDINSIIPLLIDKEYIQKSLYELICNDELLTDEHRLHITERNSPDYTDDTALADLICDALMLAITRKYKKNTGEKYYHAVSSAFSEKPKTESVSDNRLNDLFSDSKYIPPCEYFCGRDEELSELYSLIKENSKVIVVGVPGIGKSELVREYIRRYGSDYQHIGYYFYSKADEDNIIPNDLKHIIAELNGDFPYDDKELVHCYRRNLALLSSIGRKALLVIDSFNVAAHYDKNFSEVLRLKCDVIFISHAHYDFLCTYELTGFRDDEYCMELIQKYYPFYIYDFTLNKYVHPYKKEVDENNDNNDHIASQIMQYIRYIVLRSRNYPYILDFFGKQLNKGLQTPDSLHQALLDVLEERNVKKLDTKVSTQKDNSFFKGAYMDHMENLFHFSELDETEAYLLSYMRFFRHADQKDLSKRNIAHILNIIDLNVIENLIENGFIHEEDDNTISLSPILEDYIDNLIPIKRQEFEPFINRLFSEDVKTVPISLLRNLASSISLEYMSVYAESHFIGEHTLFQLHYQFENKSSMAYSMHHLAIMFRLGILPEEEKIYWEDKKIFMDNLPEEGLSDEERDFIDRADGTVLPRWNYLIPSKKYINKS